MMKLKEVGEKHVKEIAMDLVIELVPMALDEIVLKSENKIDDAILAVLKEPMKKTMLEMVEKIKF